MSSNSTSNREGSFPQIPIVDSLSQDELNDRLLFNDSLDDLLASGELLVDDLPFDEPLISQESIAFIQAQIIETAARVARGEITEIIADDF